MLAQFYLAVRPRVRVRTSFAQCPARHASYELIVLFVTVYNKGVGGDTLRRS